MIKNKYHKWYYQIMQRARLRDLIGYGENHHIKPRAFGGSDHFKNIVRLTYREHFLAHWLLTKFVVGQQKRKMLHALYMMSRVGKEKRQINSWQFDVAKRANRLATKGRKLTLEQRENISKRNIGNKYAKGYQNAKGFKHTKEFKENLSKRMKGLLIAKGYRHTKENIEFFSKLHLGNQHAKGYRHTEEAKIKMKEKQKNPTEAMLKARKEHSVRMTGRPSPRKGKRYV